MPRGPQQYLICVFTQLGPRSAVVRTGLTAVRTFVNNPQHEVDAVDCKVFAWNGRKTSDLSHDEYQNIFGMGAVRAAAGMRNDR